VWGMSFRLLFFPSLLKKDVILHFAGTYLKVIAKKTTTKTTHSRNGTATIQQLLKVGMATELNRCSLGCSWLNSAPT